MTQRTCNIIMCCKGNCHLPEAENKTALEAVAAYMSKECICPIETYKGRLLEGIMKEAMFDYMNSADRPGCDLRQLFCWHGIGVEPSMSERIANMLSLVQVRDREAPDKPLYYVNGFTHELIIMSKKELSL